jgi:hypothetical protein
MNGGATVKDSDQFNCKLQIRTEENMYKTSSTYSKRMQMHRCLQKLLEFVRPYGVILRENFLFSPRFSRILP